MAQSSETGESGAESFSRFWQDMAGSAADAARAGQQISSEMLGQMRQAFVESLRRYMDDYVRSGQFSQMMQNVLTQAVAFRGQLADFVSSAMKTSVFPEVDPEKVGDAMRRMEQRVANRFDELASRIGQLEAGGKPKRGGKKSAASAKSAKSAKSKSKPARARRSKPAAKRRR